MNIFLALVSFLLGNAKSLFKQSSTAISQQMVLHVRAIVMLLVACIGSLAIFCTSICLFIASVASQFEKSDAFNFSTVQVIYLITVIVSLVVLVHSLRRQTWLNIMDYKQAETKSAGSPIENALALLVVDFVESRQATRHENGSASEQKNTASI